MDLNKTMDANISKTMPNPPTPESNMPTLIPMAVLIIIINSFVLFLFATRKKLRTPSNYLLFSLAISDLLSGILGIPLYLAYEQTWFVDYIIGFTTITKLTTASTAYHILVITGEKYLAIINPLRHHSSNPKKVFRWLGVVWVASSFNGLVTLIWIDSKQKDVCNMGHDVFSFATVFLIPYVFIVYFQVVMIRAIAKRSRESVLIRAVTTRKKTSVVIANEKKCICIFATMASLFLFCWMPWFIIMFLLTAKHAVPLWKEKLNIGNIPVEVLTMFVVIRYCTCIINPLLYTFFKRDFMDACKSAFRACDVRRFRKPNYRSANAPSNTSELSGNKGKKKALLCVPELHYGKSSTCDENIEEVTTV